MCMFGSTGASALIHARMKILSRSRAGGETAVGVGRRVRASRLPSRQPWGDPADHLISRGIEVGDYGNRQRGRYLELAGPENDPLIIFQVAG